MSAIPSQPINAYQQANLALQAIAQQTATGQRAIADACGKEFQPPKDLVGAAQIIRRLRSERDAVKLQAQQAGQTSISQASNAVSQVQAKADKAIASLAAQLAATQKAADEFRRNVRDSLVDHQLIELPNLAGYFVGATPMQRAAEAGAVLIGIQDRIARPEFVALMRSNYLRSRGWKLGVNNSWISPAGLNLPVDNAVMKQVHIDTAPFMVFAKSVMGKSSAEAMEDGRQFATTAEKPKAFDGADVKVDDAKTAYAPGPIAPHDDESERLPMMAEPATKPIASTEAVIAIIDPADAPGVVQKTNERIEAGMPVYVGPDGATATNIREDPPGSGRIVADFNGAVRVISDPFPAQSEDDGMGQVQSLVEAAPAEFPTYTPPPEPLIAGQLRNKAHIPRPKPGTVQPTPPRFTGQVVSKPPRDTKETFTVPRLR